MASYSQSSYVPTMSPSAITFEDIATFPRPGCSAPDSINFSLDDSTVTFLSSSDGSLTRQLYAMNIASGEVKELCKPPSGTGEEDNFSLEEKLRRERARQLHTGITSYAWAEGAAGAGKILVPIGNELFVQEGLDGTLKRLFDPVVLSDDPGQYPACVRGAFDLVQHGAQHLCRLFDPSVSSGRPGPCTHTHTHTRV